MQLEAAAALQPIAEEHALADDTVIFDKLSSLNVVPFRPDRRQRDA
jgi:hypothetical protein